MSYKKSTGLHLTTDKFAIKNNFLSCNQNLLFLQELGSVQPVFHSSVLRLIKSKILLTKPPSVTLSRAWVILVVPIRC